jgi:hypothetical protein
MSMPSEPDHSLRCSACGAPLRSSVLKSICPACLLLDVPSVPTDQWLSQEIPGGAARKLASAVGAFFIPGRDRPPWVKKFVNQKSIETPLLKTAQTLYIADAQWRASNPKAARAAYQNYVNRCAEALETDFVPIEEVTGAASPTLSTPNSSIPSTQPLSQTALAHYADLSDFERDIIKPNVI